MQDFSNEYTNLVHKNYDGQRRKWDDAAKATTEESTQEMWQLMWLISPRAK